MNKYIVSLTRTYFISIKAESEEKAKRYSEFYLGDFHDLSTKEEKLNKKFLIEKIEMIDNNATEII